jgi:copper homeostasis protein
MIRPRSGEYILQEGDIAVMTADIRLALARGAKGVVVGALLPDGRLDREAMARFRDAASDATIVLHRAIDLSADPVATVREARALGFDKVLSSGGAISAPLGVHILARMVDAAGPDLAVIAGGGVRSDNVAALVAESGVREVHSSASRSALPPSGKTVRLGFAHGPRRLTERAIVAKMRDVLAGLETSI